MLAGDWRPAAPSTAAKAGDEVWAESPDPSAIIDWLVKERGAPKP